MSLIDLSKKRFASIIFAISFGNFLEWYELSLYVYWAPILSKLFFSGDDIVALIKIFMIFGVGFLARPLGGIFFGRLGDRIGRRKSLILSILLMTFPTFITGLLPTYAQIGIAAPLLLGVMRILQSFPAGGEFPGAFCYLYESAPLSKRRFMCSWAGIGYQLGIFFGMIECFMLKQLLTEDQIIEWGWRFSFILGGILGLFGLFLRSNLHETPLFLEMQEHEKLTRQSFKRVIIENKKPMILGILFTAASSSTFYALSINFLKDGSKGDILLSMFFFALLTLPLPLYGMFGDRYNNKRALIISTLISIILLISYMFNIFENNMFIIVLFCVFFNLQAALITFLIPDLFETRIRFTCTALSFNLADAFFGGFTPVAALYLQYITGLKNSLYWIVVFITLISFFSFFKIKERHSIMS